MYRVLIQTEGRTGKTQEWNIRVMQNRTVVTWAQHGGKAQTTIQTHKAVNVGKANEKSSEQTAIEWAERQILLKRREGYKEINPETRELLEEAAVGEISSFSDLPSNLRFYKPQNSLSKYLDKLIENKKAWYVRKRNGEMMVAAKDENANWRLYSSKLLIAHKNEIDAGIPWSDRLPHIIHDLNELDLPCSTILLGELVSSRDDDDLLRVGSIMKSLTPRALELQKSQPLCYCIWDLAYLQNEPVLCTQSYAWRTNAISEAMSKSSTLYLTTPEVFPSYEFEDKQVALEHAKSLNWEGWVVVDPDAPGYGDKAMSFHGKADRPLVCGKLKPKFEADFIARWDPENGIGTWGKGKKSTGVGALFLYLWDPETQQEVYVSKCGGGLHDEDVQRLANPSLYPMAVQVEFGSWTPEGSLQFPEYVRDRPDKTPQDCTIDQRPALEEE